MADGDSESTSVRATVELTGDYEQIAEILGREHTRPGEMSSLVEDMTAVLEIVTRTGGATKSRIAEELPPGVSAELDADAVIHVLRVLELYGLVELDGNTWRPGHPTT
jgi:hypothetical protein